MKCPNCYRTEFSNASPCGASNKPGDWCTYYMPSNGSEGICFTSEWCDNCIHQHPDPEKQPQCDAVLLQSLIGKQPGEWIIRNGKPVCTAFVSWDWGNDLGGWNEPPQPDPIGPNQLVMPFALMEILGEDWEDIIVTPLAVHERF